MSPLFKVSLWDIRIFRGTRARVRRRRRKKMDYGIYPSSFDAMHVVGEHRFKRWHFLLLACRIRLSSRFARTTASMVPGRA